MATAKASDTRVHVVHDYEQFGGVHWLSAALCNVLEHAGVETPHSGRPLSEPMCFGIGGGIAGGYSFCPSIPGDDAGSGVSIVGRYGAYATGAVNVQAFFKRLGVRTVVKETAGRTKAFAHLTRALDAGMPAIVWCAPPRRLGRGWAGTGGTYTTVVHAVNERNRTAGIADCAGRSIEWPLRELGDLRAKVSSHRSRVLTIDPPRHLTPTVLRTATLAGIRACAGDMLQPKLKIWNLPGLLEWARLIANPDNRRGWPRVYPGGRMYAALRDAFDSIETASTGGGLFRFMYADFLVEAAGVTRKTALKRCAKTYRALGQEWQALAGMLLPSSVRPFKQTQSLLKQRERIVRRGGPRMAEQLSETREDLQGIETAMRRRFPLDHATTMELLTDAAEAITTLHDAEQDAARSLMMAAR